MKKIVVQNNKLLENGTRKTILVVRFTPFDEVIL
jgi:hypothetical protein